MHHFPHIKEKSSTTFNFYGVAVTLILDEAGRKHVVPSELCERLGLAWAPQYRKLTGSMFAKGITRMVRPSNGGPQSVLVLSVRYLGTWLLSISAKRVTAELKDTLVALQEELVDAIEQYMFEGVAVNPRISEPQAHAKVQEHFAPKFDFTTAMSLIEQLKVSGELTQHEAALRGAVAFKEAYGFDILGSIEGKLSRAPRVVVPVPFEIGENGVTAAALTPVVDLRDFLSAKGCGAPFGLSGRVVGDIARAMDIFRKKTNKIDEYGKDSLITRNGEPLDEHWCYSRKSFEMMVPVMERVRDIRNDPNNKMTYEVAIQMAITELQRDQSEQN